MNGVRNAVAVHFVVGYRYLCAGAYIVSKLPQHIDNPLGAVVLHLAVMVLFLCDKAVKQHSVLCRGEFPELSDDTEKLLPAERPAPDKHLDDRKQLAVAQEIVNMYRVALGAAVVNKLGMTRKLAVFCKETAYLADIARNALGRHSVFLRKLRYGYFFSAYPAQKYRKAAFVFFGVHKYLLSG